MSFQDSFGRTFSYLRLSITPFCNFRCRYCLPNGNPKGEKKLLSPSEIRRLVSAFSTVGVQKVRLTGGEPTLRKDVCEIIREISSLTGIYKIGLTTNGFNLAKSAPHLHASGITHLNVSVDSLSPSTFCAITGQDRLADVLSGVTKALEAGFASVKVNCVLLKGINDGEVMDFVKWTRHTPLSVRFIELMPTQDNALFFHKHYLSPELFRSRLVQEGWTVRKRSLDAGPAVELIHPDYRGAVGFILPYGKHFCESCNRLRVSATGDLKLCLLGESHASLKSLLQSDLQKMELINYVQQLLSRKKVSHFLHEGSYGHTLASIGG